MFAAMRSHSGGSTFFGAEGLGVEAAAHALRCQAATGAPRTDGAPNNFDRGNSVEPARVNLPGLS
eukprot:5764881-Pyramimonas_sp.AAC.1